MKKVFPQNRHLKNHLHGFNTLHHSSLILVYIKTYCEYVNLDIKSIEKMASIVEINHKIMEPVTVKPKGELIVYTESLNGKLNIVEVIKVTHKTKSKTFELNQSSTPLYLVTPLWLAEKTHSYNMNLKPKVMKMINDTYEERPDETDIKKMFNLKHII